MILVELRFIHYSPKDYEEGIKEFFIAKDEVQILAYIDKEHMFGSLKDHEDDEDDDNSCSPSEEWVEQHPKKIQEAKDLGLKVDEEYGLTVEGPTHLLIKWYQGNTWQEATDCYYGVTHYEWDRQRTITEDHADVLIGLSMAKDIRDWKDEE